ncbi:MAG: S8 family serine peptidase [Lachnospiraceae bacterium]|nr:S8 family serine peptidase [Lachnospiraceae bacterium]
MKSRKRILAFLLAVSMTATGSGSVYAAETVPSAAVTAIENETGEVNQEAQDENKTEEAGDIQDKAEGASEDTAVSEQLTPEVRAEEAVSGNTSYSMLKGMPDGFKLNETELLGKKRITGHNVVSELEKLTPGVDYVEDEVIFSCEDPEYARLVAEAYNGTLDSCELGVAVIKLDTTTVSVKDAVAAGADPAVPLPPVDINYKNYLTDPVKDTSAVITDKSLLGAAHASKKNAIDGRDWTYWTSKFNDVALRPDFTFYDPDSKAQRNGYQWMHDAVDTYKAWGVTRGAGVTVAVIDTGVYAGHEDLGGRVNDDARNIPDFKDKVDLEGHGTHVAGIIGAEANNALGGIGIAPEVNLLNVPIFVMEIDENGTAVSFYKSSDLVKGINYVINGGNPRADIINMSLGGPIYSEAEQKAVSDAHDAGITLCIAMGNDNSNNMAYPAAYDNVVAVAAMDESWQKSGFSTYGPWADIAAPGSDIFSTWNGHDEKNNTIDYNYYSSWNGTSMATPVVAGICALYISAARAAGIKTDPDMVEEALKKSAAKVSSTYQIGAGMVNAANMLSLLEDKSAPAINVPAALSPGSSITLSDKNAAGGTLGYIYTINGKKPSADKGDIKEGFYKEAINGAVDITVSELIENGLMADESVKLQVVRITGLGTATEIAREDITINSSSVSGASISGPIKLAKGKSAVYTLKPSFPKGKVKWSIEGDSKVTVNAKTGKVTAKKTSSGSFTLKAEAEGKTSELTVELVDPASFISLKAEAADMDINMPVTANNGNIKSVRMFNVDLGGNDKQENILKLTGSTDNKTDVAFTSSKPSVAEVDKDGKVTAKKAGTTKITCKATDGSGKKSTATIKVMVPVSRLDLFEDKGQKSVAFGKSMKLRPAFGSAYGKPSVRRVTWAEQPLKVYGISSNKSIDVTSNVNKEKYIKIKNGKLTVNKNISQIGYSDYYCAVSATAADGSGIICNKFFRVTAPTTYINLGDYGVEEELDGTRYYVIEFKTDSIVTPAVTSSNPRIGSIKISEFKDGIAICIVPLVNTQKGTVTLTAKATDGTGKSKKFKLRIK